MKRILFIMLIFVCFSFIASKCIKESDACHKTIHFVNNSSKELYIKRSSILPHNDTLGFVSYFPNPYNQPELYRVKQGEKNSNGLSSRDCLDNEAKNNNIFIYVFDAEVLASNSWGIVGMRYMVLKTYRPTFEEMQNSNWTITYTGE